MRFIVTGVKNGKSCVIEEVDCTPQGEDVSTKTLLDLPAGALPPRPAGKAMHIDIGVPAGAVRWLRVRFRPNQTMPNHHTDSIDCFTVVSGSVDLVLDDGPHRLAPGDCAVVKGVDHSWKTGAQDCVISTLIFGTPAA